MEGRHESPAWHLLVSCTYELGGYFEDHCHQLHQNDGSKGSISICAEPHQHHINLVVLFNWNACIQVTDDANHLGFVSSATLGC